MRSGAVRFVLFFCFLSPVAVRGESAWDQLRIGMTEVEAEAILGASPAAQRRAGLCRVDLQPSRRAGVLWSSDRLVGAAGRQGPRASGRRMAGAAARGRAGGHISAQAEPLSAGGGTSRADRAGGRALGRSLQAVRWLEPTRIRYGYNRNAARRALKSTRPADHGALISADDLPARIAASVASSPSRRAMAAAFNCCG
jgi:hypothetical protein